MTNSLGGAADSGGLSWNIEAPATEFLLSRGQIERVEPNPSHARTLLADASRHLASARLLSTTDDVAAAFVTAYDAARKALTAILALQGLRARGGDGGHRVLGELVQSHLPDQKRTVREFDWMRQKRNDTEYPDPERPTATSVDVADGIAAAEAIVDLARRFVG